MPRNSADDEVDVDIGHLILQTDGASPAFIEELVRKAALVAAEENSLYDGTLRLTNDHFQTALLELITGDRKLTRNLLGFAPSARAGY